MAELAALGVAASIIQVIDVGIRVLKRLEEYGKQAKGLPKVLQPIYTRLRVCVRTLNETKLALDAISEDARKDIEPCIDGCFSQIQALEVIIKKISTEETDSKATRGLKAVISMTSEKEIKEIDKVIQEYIQTLANYSVLTNSAGTLASKSSSFLSEST